MAVDEDRVIGEGVVVGDYVAEVGHGFVAFVGGTAGEGWWGGVVVVVAVEGPHSGRVRTRYGRIMVWYAYGSLISEIQLRLVFSATAAMMAPRRGVWAGEAASVGLASEGKMASLRLGTTAPWESLASRERVDVGLAVGCTPCWVEASVETRYASRVNVVIDTVGPSSRCDVSLECESNNKGSFGATIGKDSSLKPPVWKWKKRRNEATAKAEMTRDLDRRSRNICMVKGYVSGRRNGCCA